ncbi:MAG: NAD(P)-dependent oxidoreductase, partial [bacterium]
MKILVTGASGFIGSHLVRDLANRYEIIALVPDWDPLSGVSGIEVIEGNLADSGFIERLPRSIDAIVHLAQGNFALPEGGPDLFTVNTGIVVRLAEYARRANASSFVFTSSGNVYPPRMSETLREDIACRPKGFYAVTKYASELILECYAEYMNISILRLFAPYGPGQVNRMIPGIIERVYRDQPVILNNGGEPRINPIFITDLVPIIEQALILKGFHTANVAGPEVVDVRQIAELAAEFLERGPQFEERTVPE